MIGFSQVGVHEGPFAKSDLRVLCTRMAGSPPQQVGVGGSSPSKAIEKHRRKRKTVDTPSVEPRRKTVRTSYTEIRHYVQKSLPSVLVNKLELNLASDRKIKAWGFLVENSSLHLTFFPESDGAPLC